MGLLSRVKLSLDDYLRLPKLAKRDAETGREVLDHVPIAPPIGWFKQPSMFDQVRDMVRSEHMRLYAESQGAETFEEASDFDVEDEMFPTSQFEDAGDFEPLANLQARRQREFELEFNRKREERLRKREERQWAEEDALDASSSARKPGVEAGGAEARGGSPRTPPAPSSDAPPPHSTVT